MKTSDFYYELPEAQIAQTPVEPRDHSRLMVIDRMTGEIEHRHFYDIVDYLNPGDALVVNETRVMPARLLGQRPGGGSCEILLLRQIAPQKWETLVRPGKKLRPGSSVSFGGGSLEAHILSETDAGGRVVEFVCEGTLEERLDELGEMPLPPYIHEKLRDRERYQTVYAREEGSAAAPTAGLHFTKELIEKIRAKGVDFVPILLHVGLGTFRPVKAEDVAEHKMHAEFYCVSEEAAARINAARRRGGRIVAVGTTSVRTLESSSAPDGAVLPGSGWTEIFIKPGYRFRAVDAMITNFHLPGSTLLMLVSAFIGREPALIAYETAVREGYRFFSFGDATFLKGGEARLPWSRLYNIDGLSFPPYDGWLDKYLPALLTAGSVADLGCGNSVNALYLGEKGIRVIACDFAEEALRLMEKALPGIETKNFNLLDGVPFADNRLDAAIADLSLHYFDLPTTGRVLSDIRRALKPGGMLLMRVNSEEELRPAPGDREIERLYYLTEEGVAKRFFDEAMLRAVLAGFEILRIEKTAAVKYQGAVKHMWEVCVQKPAEA